MRKSIANDGQLQFFYPDRIFPTRIEGTLNFIFAPSKNEVVSPNTPECIFRKPIIYCSHLSYNILSHKKDTTQKVFDLCKSLCYHETTHYLQVSKDLDSIYLPKNNSKEEFVKYISVPDEFDGWAVGTFYFLSQYDPVQLNLIMTKKLNDKQRKEALINGYFKIFRPDIDQMFK